MVTSSTEQNNSLRHTYLQKLITYLLFRPSLIINLSKDDHFECLGITLNANEKKWILEIDSRRWSIDQERRHRSIEGALFHCPVTGIALSSFLNSIKHIYKNHSNTLSFLLSFFQSVIFEECIRDGKYIVDSLIEWIFNELASLNLPSKYSIHKKNLTEIIKVEQAVIVGKRKPYTVIKSDTVLDKNHIFRLSDLHSIVTSYEGVVEAYLALHQKALSITQTGDRTPLLLGNIDLSILPINYHQTQSILIENQESGISVESLSKSLAEVLLLAQSEITLEALLNHLIQSDVDPTQAEELISTWMEDGLIL
jgi:hypothetical protein